MITRQRHTPYSGMLPGLVAGHYGFDDIHIDCPALARVAGAALRLDEAIGLDTAGKRVLCRDGGPVPYDLVSIDVGSTPNTRAVDGAFEHAVPVKPIDQFLPRFEALRARASERGGRRRIAVVGAGPAGVELILAARHRLRRDMGDGAGGLSFVLVSGSPEILPQFPDGARSRAVALLHQRGIGVAAGAPVDRVEPGRLCLGGGGSVDADEVLWTVHAAPAPWLAETGLALDGDGFLRVDATLRATGRHDVFAAGDVIAFDPRPIPKSGVYSVRAGRVLAENLRRAVAGQEPALFRPQRDALYLLTTGGRHAIGTRNGLTVAGRWVWRWKDHIDRSFMRRFAVS